MTLKQKLFQEYRVNYRVWFEMDWKERNEKLDIGESVALTHAKSEISAKLNLISGVLGKKDREILTEIASEEICKVYEEKCMKKS